MLRAKLVDMLVEDFDDDLNYVLRRLAEKGVADADITVSQPVFYDPGLESGKRAAAVIVTWRSVGNGDLDWNEDEE